MSKHIATTTRASCFILISLLVGCQTTDNIQMDEPIPFVFRSLNLRHKRVNGDRDWDLTSPEAKYESSRRIVRARLPEGILYKDSNPSFEISALNATIFNDGETVLLEGEVKLQQLGGQKVLIIGDRLRWTPDKSLMVIDQRPQALNSDSRLVAKRAEFQQQTHDLLLIGPTQLERWEEIRTPKQKPITIIRGRDGVWNLDSGKLVTQGPIMGTREPKGEDSIQTITSSGLRGNTKAGYIDLINPVGVNLPSENGNLQAKTTRWDFKREELESNKPFTGQLEKSSYSGDAFKVDLSGTTVQIPKTCKFKQPGEQLFADQCFFNWTTEKIKAIGNVVLKRDSNDQTTRSERLEGHVGEDGRVTFSSPGSQVLSELTLKESTPQNAGQVRENSP